MDVILSPPSRHRNDDLVDQIIAQNIVLIFSILTHPFLASCISSVSKCIYKMGGKKGGAGENSKKAAGNARVCINPAPATYCRVH